MKKMIAIIMVTLMLAMMGVSAFAGGVFFYENEDVIQPRTPTCDKCGSGTYLEYVETSKWKLIGYTECNVHPQYNDRVEERTVTKCYKCEKCGVEMEHKMTETRTVCKH